MFRRRRELEIEYKTPEQIRAMRPAGLVVAEALAATRQAVAPGVSTADLDALAEKVIRAAGAVPSFKGYYGFPGSICASVNEQIVHSIPRPDTVLREGDVISIDCGAIVDGWHGDAAVTVPVGDRAAVDPDVLVMAEVAEEAMWAGIAAAARGLASGQGRLTDISHAVQTRVRQGGGRRPPSPSPPTSPARSMLPPRGSLRPRTRRRYGIVTGYGGHGIGTEMHQDPHLLNHGRPGRGPRLVPGLVLAIEPMLTLGRPRTVELEDEWTVVTLDGSRAVHVEHTFALLEDGIWVLTAGDGGASRLGDHLSGSAS